MFVNGIINGGFFIRTKFLNATTGNGTIVDSTILNIKNLGGLLIDCSIKTGELSGGFVRSNNLSFVINDCIISDTDINIYNKEEIQLNKYKNDSIIVGKYIDAYSEYNNTSTFIFINNCSLISPKCKISKENTNRVFINKQQNIKGGDYENINLNFPQIIDGGNFKNTNISYTDKVANSVFCSVRPVRVLTDDNGTTNKVYTMFEYDNNGQIPFININVIATPTTPTTAMNLYGYIYTKLANNGTGNNVIFDTFSLNVLDYSNNYDPRKYNDTKYENISPTGDTYVILDLEYDDYMFGDFGLLYLSTNGNINSNDKYVINGGKFEKCELNGITNSRMSIYGGVYDNTNFNGSIDIYSCNFNGGKISGNSNVWYSGNFNSGNFGDDSTDEKNEYILNLCNGPHMYLLKEGENIAQITTFTGKNRLENIYPLIIRREYTENNVFDTIGELHDEEYQEYYLDIWNETNIDFTGATYGISNEVAWTDKITNSEQYMIVPSHFVFIVGNSSAIELQNMLSFVQKSSDISIYDVTKNTNFNILYNEYYKSNNGDIPVNDFLTQYVGYYINKRTYHIAFVFKFNKIEELYNNTLNKNQQWFNNIFQDYSLYYKNIWSEANSGYFVRPMPVFNFTNDAEYSSINITEDYDNYPLPLYNGLYYEQNLPAPWHFDNNGKIWLPLHQSSIKDSYDIYKSRVSNYSKNYFKDTNDILPYDYFNFRKDIKSSFNTSLPLSKKVKNDYITDSIEINSNINNYININDAGTKTLLKVDEKNLWLYEGGWEKYVDIPFNFKINKIDNIEESWLYLDQYFNINGFTDSIGNNMKFIHVVSHGENLLNDYDGPCRILQYGNVRNDNSLCKIKIDKKITNNYGHAFVVDSNNFIFNNNNKTIQIINYGENNYKVSVGSYLYIYTPTYKGKVTVSEYNGLSGNNISVKISENISILSNDESNFVYGLDMWTIDELNTPNGLTTNVSRLDINIDTSRNSTGFNGSIIPSNEIINKWSSSDPIFIYSESINTKYTSNVKNIYPNEYVQGKIVKIKNIKENYDGMYLYDTIFDYSKNKEANKVNTYLYDSINIPKFNKIWMKDTATNNIIGNSIDFDSSYKLLDGYQKLSGTLIRYKNMCSFKKVTNMFKINADTTVTDYDKSVSKISNNKDYIEIHDENGAILSGVYESNNVSSIIIESFTKNVFSQSILTGFSTYSLRTLPIHYTGQISGSPINIDRGNYIEFTKSLNNTILTPVFRINSSNGITIVTVKCDLRDTFYNMIMNINNYLYKEVAILAKDNIAYVYYRGKINAVRINNNGYDAEVDFILGYDISKLSKVEFGYFYIIEEMTEGPCYKYYTTNETGIEITENDIYHYNNGDPTKLIQNSPKAILMNINKVVRTTEESFERQAGITITSKYNLINGEETYSDIFRDGNFYSGEFYGDWYNGDWFAGSNSFKGDNYYNKQAGLDFTKAPERKESTIKNFTEIINSLIKRGEYFMYPPWSSKERQIVVTPKITRSDEY